MTRKSQKLLGMIDDLFTGADVFNEAYIKQNQMTDVLTSACMPLRKKSNDSNLIKEPTDSCLELYQEGNVVNKTLGLNWQTSSDCLLGY